MLLPFHECDLSDDCTCRSCAWQPPTLAACAQYVLFNYTLHLHSFRLDVNKTHDRFVYAARSNRVPRINLLRSEAPVISGSWISQSEWSYDSNSSAAMINDLRRHKNHFWCHHCERGPFFPLTCTEHADTEVFEEGVEAGDEELLGDDADFVF